MTLKKLQEGIIKVARTYCERYGVAVDQDLAVLKLYEEVGEFAQAVLIHRRKCRPEKYVTDQESKKMLADELADIVGLAMINAHLFEIDLEKAIEEKWLSERIHEQVRDRAE